MSKQRVLIIAQNFYPEIGSAGNRMKNIFQLLKQEEYDVTVLTTEPSYPNRTFYYDEQFWDDNSMNTEKNIHRIMVRNKKYSINMFNRLLYYIEIAIKMLWFICVDCNEYDVVFVSSPPIFIGFVGLWAKFRYRAKMILDIRDLWPESLKGVEVFNYRVIIWLFTLLETQLYRKANYIVVNSEGFIGHIKSKLKNKETMIKFIPNAARLYEIPVKEKHSHESFKVIYTGNIGLAQDVEFLKELAFKLNQQEIQLNIVGYGLRRSEFKEYVKINKLSNVHFFHPVKREECLKLNVEHDVGILSLNDKEVFDTVLPGKLIDYMTTGLPVIAAVSGYSQTMIEKHETGFVSESRDINEIMGYILYLKNNPAIKQKMKKNSLNVIKSTFLWEENIHSLIELIEEELYKEIPYYKQTNIKVDKVEING